jgi:hypothetical protein
MSSIVVELGSTRTAQWYQAASGSPRAEAWAERLRYFSALSELLAELVAGQRPAHRATRRDPASQPRQLPQIVPRGLVTEVARRAHFAAHETLYKRFRPDWEGPIARWAGSDNAVKPCGALVAEAKIVSFWPHRDGVLRLAGQPDVPLPEVAGAYLLAVAQWASDDIPLAACRPAGPPACVAEDMRVIAARWLRHAVAGRLVPVPRPLPRAGSPDGAADGPPGGGRDLLADKQAQLERLTRRVVGSLLENPGLPAAKAVEATRPELGRLLADPADPVVDRLARTAAQLSDRLVRPAAAGRPVTAQQARSLLATLVPLTSRLSAIAAELPARLAASRDGWRLVGAGLHGRPVEQLVARLLP